MLKLCHVYWCACNNWSEIRFINKNKSSMDRRNFQILSNDSSAIFHCSCQNMKLSWEKAPSDLNMLKLFTGNSKKRLYWFWEKKLSLKKLSWLEMFQAPFFFSNKQNSFQITSSFRNKRNKLRFLCIKLLFVVSKPRKGKKIKQKNDNELLHESTQNVINHFWSSFKEPPFGLLIVWFTAISSFS